MDTKALIEQFQSFDWNTIPTPYTGVGVTQAILGSITLPAELEIRISNSASVEDDLHGVTILFDGCEIWVTWVPYNSTLWGNEPLVEWVHSMRDIGYKMIDLPYSIADLSAAGMDQFHAVLSIKE